MPDERQNGARVLEAYGDGILRLAYSYLHSRTDAEDVLQDTLVQYLTKRPVFEGPAHEKAWLMRVAINLCKNQLSAPWKRRWEELDEDQPCFDQEESAVLEAVNGLPVKYREVIHLYYVEGYSTAEIASLLGRGEGAVRVQLSRGRERLRRVLKEAYDFGEE